MEFSLFQELDALRIPHTRGGKTRNIGRIVFSMIFFMTRSRDPALRDQLLAAEAHCRTIFPLETYRWCAPHGEGALPVNTRDAAAMAKAYGTLAERIKGPTTYFGLYDFDPDMGEVPGHAMEFATDVSDDHFGGQSSFQLNIPLPWFERQGTPGLAQKIFADLTRILQPLHAQAGLAMATSVDDIWTQKGAENLYPLLYKFRGLMSGWAGHYRIWMGTSMGAINWLTAVHDDLIARCGGPEAVLAQLDLPGFAIDTFPTGFIIQAGPTPQLCNREAGEGSPHYGRVARALRPVRFVPKRDGKGASSAYQIPGTYEAGDRRDLVLRAEEEYLTRFDDM
jgi:hypothetical protein